MKWDSLSDTELLTRYRIGNDQCARVFYERHSSWLERDIAAKGVPPCDVTEITQQTFIAFFLDVESAHPKFDMSLDARPWLRTIARRKMIDYFRRTKRNQVRERPLKCDIESYQPVDENLDEPIAGNKLLLAIVDFLGTQSIEEQNLFNARFTDPEFSFSSYCKSIGIEPTQKNLHDLRQCLHRLLVRIRKHMKQFEITEAHYPGLRKLSGDEDPKRC
ncbi:MAG: sigma-70 family RNA polymerase sigma factor [Pirellulaceae bacterium]